MQAFVHEVSSFEGAEVPENRDSEAVSLDVDSFFKDMKSVMKQIDREENFDDADDDEGSDSDMDFDDSEDGSDPAEDEYRKDTFMESYSDTLKEELKATTLEKSFIRADGQSSKKDSEGTSNIEENMDEDLTPVGVDINLVKRLLDSFSSQQGLPGPASNLLGIMGLQIPKDANKDK